MKKAKPRHTDENTNLGGFVRLLRGRECFLDLSLEAKGDERELLVAARKQKSVEATAGLDRAQGSRTDAELDLAAQGVAVKRHLLQIGNESPIGSVSRLGDIVPKDRFFTCEFAATRHFILSASSWRQSGVGNDRSFRQRPFRASYPSKTGG